MDMLNGNVANTEKKVNNIDAPDTFKKLGVTKNDVISLVVGLVTGVTVAKVTNKKALGIAAGTVVTFVVADGLDTFRLRDKYVAEIEADGGTVISAEASMFGGLHIKYTDKDGNDGVITTRK